MNDLCAELTQTCFLLTFFKQPCDKKCKIVCLFVFNVPPTAKALFSRNLAYAKFRENEIPAKWQNQSVDC